jgi:hypothetical protein
VNSPTAETRFLDRLGFDRLKPVLVQIDQSIALHRERLPAPPILIYVCAGREHPIESW